MKKYMRVQIGDNVRSKTVNPCSRITIVKVGKVLKASENIDENI